MNVLVIGCGAVGWRVARALRENGHRVIGSTRSPSKAERLDGEGIEPILFDVSDPGTFDALPEVDLCIHCLGFDRASGVGREAVIVEGLRRTLGRLEGRIGRLVACGTIGVYGDHGGAWIDERTTAEPLSESGRIALDAERLVEAFGGRDGVPSTVLRLAGLYGPGRIIRRAAIEAGEPIASDATAFLNLVHLDDAAAAIVAASTAESPAPLYLVADDRPLRRDAYYEELARALNAPPPRFTAGGDREPNRRISNRKIKDELGFEPTYPDVTLGLRALLATSPS